MKWTIFYVLVGVAWVFRKRLNMSESDRRKRKSDATTDTMPQAPRPSVSPPAGGLVGRIRATVGRHSVAVFVALAGVLGLVGYFIYPPIEATRVLSRAVDISFDGDATEAVTDVSYTERQQSDDGFQARFVVGINSEELTSSENLSDSMIRIILPLPDPDISVQCVSWSGMLYDCRVDDGRLLILGAGNGVYFSVTVDVVGVSGFVLDATRTAAEVRLPVFEGPPSGTRAITSLEFDGAGKVSWSGDRPDSSSEDSSLWIWDLGVGKQPEQSLGSREDVLQWDAARTFLAGILLGIAGAAVIAAVQAGYANVEKRASSINQ